MILFLDFEASALARRSYPIEVAWVFEDGVEEAYLIHPAPEWDDWDPSAEAIHGICRATLLKEGASHEMVARHMVERLSGHDLTASAPSWDGKWLSALLRAAGLPRHSLRLRDTEAAQRDTARAILRGHLPDDQLDRVTEHIRAQALAERPAGRPVHRALADAQEERDRWLTVKTAAERFVADVGPDR